MYIRTKNKIYQVESTLRDNGFVKGYNVGEMAFIRKDQVLNQSENLEGLCDRFIFHYQRIIDNKVVDNFYRDFWFLWQAKETFDNCKIESKEIKGAIYTDKGLIYVAKMNDKGELVLI